MQKTLIAALLTVAAIPAANAAIISGYSEGQAVSVSASLLGTPLLAVGAPPLVSGSFPGPYSAFTSLPLAAAVRANAVVPLTVPVPIFGNVGVDANVTLNANVNSNQLSARADGNSMVVSGASSVTNLNVGLGTNAAATVNLGLAQINLNIFDSAFDLNLAALSSMASVTDTGSMLVTGGQSVVTGLDLGLFTDGLLQALFPADFSFNIDQLVLDAGLGADLSSDTIGFNFDVFDVLGVSSLTDSLGLSLILNERIEVCPTVFECEIEINALRLSADVLPGLTLAGLDVKLGHSYARALADFQDPAGVPEPGLLALLGVGVGGLLLARRRRTFA